jgi:hypothetical protein
MYAPIDRTHRVTLQQMAILEPALVETLAQSCIELVKKATTSRLKKACRPKPRATFCLAICASRSPFCLAK